MIVMKNSKKKLVSIGQYKILNTLQSNEDKDIFHVKDLKSPFREFTLRILKSHQNPRQIDNEIEILEILNPYKETLNFLHMEMFADKLLFVFVYSKGMDLQKIYSKDHSFFDNEKIKLFVDDMVRILSIYKENNIIHRNIKAENILFDGEHYYLIGLSKAIVDENSDSNEDIYSFLSILYMLVKEESFEGKEVQKEELYNIIKSLKVEHLREYIDKI